MSIRRSTLIYVCIITYSGLLACLNLGFSNFIVPDDLTSGLPIDFFLAESKGRKLSPTKSKRKKDRNLSLPALDELCGGCRKIKIDTKQKITCGSLIYNTAKRENISLSEAARYEVEYHTYLKCRPCLPESCDKPARMYWRYDDAAPSVLAASSSYLSSIVGRNRVPVELLGNSNIELADHFQSHMRKIPKRDFSSNITQVS